MDIKKKGIGMHIAAILLISVFATMSVTARQQQKQTPLFSERRGGAL